MILKEDQENKLLIELFLEDTVKNTVRRPKVRSVKSTNILDTVHEGNEVDEDDEYKNIIEPELSTVEFEISFSSEYSLFFIYTLYFIYTNPL